MVLYKKTYIGFDCFSKMESTYAMTEIWNQNWGCEFEINLPPSGVYVLVYRLMEDDQCVRQGTQIVKVGGVKKCPVFLTDYTAVSYMRDDEETDINQLMLHSISKARYQVFWKRVTASKDYSISVKFERLELTKDMDRSIQSCLEQVTKICDDYLWKPGHFHSVEGYRQCLETIQ